MKKTFLYILLSVLSSQLSAQIIKVDSLALAARVGYTIGGTSPMGMPASIRGLNSFTPCVAWQAGVEAEYQIDKLLGVQIGLQLDRKAMKIDARVKGYKMKMTQGGQEIAGYFTGNVVSRYSTLSMVIPVQAVLHLRKHWKMRLGPFFQLNTTKNFDGYAYDGYLRKDSPTGAKIEIGNSEEERGNYDFSDDLKKFNWGLDFGVDYKIGKTWAVYGDFQMSFTPAFKSNFTTIEQSMYAMYGSIGVSKTIVYRKHKK